MHTRNIIYRTHENLPNIDIRTKTTLDSLEAKNRTNIARRPGHIIIDIRTKKTVDSLEAKNRTNIIIAKANLFKLKLDGKSFIDHRRLHPLSPPPSPIRTPLPSRLLTELLSPSRLHNS